MTKRLYDIYFDGTFECCQWATSADDAIRQHDNTDESGAYRAVLSGTVLEVA